MSEEKKTLKTMFEVMAEFKDSKFKEKKVNKSPPHELSAVVDEIQKFLGFKKDDKYGYKYWLRKAKGYSYTEILGILKELGSVPDKYNKGGLLTNRLSNKKYEYCKRK